MKVFTFFIILALLIGLIVETRRTFKGNRLSMGWILIFFILLNLLLCILLAK